MSDLVERAKRAQAALYRKAQEDFNVFAELVGVNDETGEPIRQSRIHKAWDELISKHERLIIMSHRFAGKSYQISQLRVVWELGRNPNLRILLISATAAQAQKLILSIASIIEKSENVKKIFPGLEPDYERTWTNTALTVKRKTFSKDPSVLGVGIHGAITGGRADLAIIDDPHSPENSATPEQRNKVISWYRATVPGALTKTARIICVTNAWHPTDLPHTLERESGFVLKRFPIYNDNGEITWPEEWDEARIQKMRDDLGPLEFARQMMCRSRSDEDARFKAEWFEHCKELGKELEIVTELALEDRPEGSWVFTGVDLAVSKKRKSDATVLFTILVHANGRRQILNVKSGKLSGPQILEECINAHERYGSILVVESVAAQMYILQFATATTAIPVVPFNTNAQTKNDPSFGVESIAIEIANGTWIIPSKGNKKHAEIEKWIEECLFYSPHGHTGDRLMASWFAREEARKRMTRSKSSTPAVRLQLVG